MIFSLGNPPRVPPGGMSGITDNLANFWGYPGGVPKAKDHLGLDKKKSESGISAGMFVVSEAKKILFSQKPAETTNIG